MKKNTDYTVYLVTDRELMSSETVEDAVEKAIDGGATIVQLREKNLNSLDFYNQALKVKNVCRKKDIPFIINDRIDIALAVGADGVHLGQDDIPVEIARKIMGKDKIIGVSAGTVPEAIKAEKDGADYLGVGAMFSTGTKTDADICGKEGLIDIVRSVEIPIVIIGGMNEKTIPMFADVDIDGVAVVSAIIAKDDITAAARLIKEKFTLGRRRILHGIKGAIFDLDGTLFNSMDVWKNIDSEFLGKRGIAVPTDYMDAVSAKSFKECAEYTVARFGLKESPDQLMDEWNEMALRHYVESVELLPYVKEYLDEIKKRGIKTAVATSLKREFYEPCLKRNGIWDMFDAVCSVDDVGKGKERPDVFYLAAQRMGLNSGECVIFDDAYAAIKSAKKTDAFVIGVYEKHSAPLADKISSLADMYICNFKQAPILHKL